ncbi:protein DJ-1 D-like [Populus alba x Populus x berolinensis]|nr:protein DJ-1 D-like [Populus alba x Populus x berolinensis]
MANCKPQKKVLLLCGDFMEDYEGRKCTAYPAVKLNVVLGGATWLEPDPIDRCYTDENLVTGAAWPGHPQFVSQLMALLGIRVSF